jgi:hypothetical protein
MLSTFLSSAAEAAVYLSSMDAVVSGQGVNDTPRLHHRSPPTSSWLSSSSTATSNAHEKCSTNEMSKTSHLIANNFIMLFRRRFVDPSKG